MAVSGDRLSAPAVNHPLPGEPDASSVALRVRADTLQQFLAQWRAALIGLAVLTACTFVAGMLYAPSAAWIVWLLLTGLNTLLQAAVCRAMERAETPAAAARSGLPRLTAIIFVNSFVWGAMPFLAAQAAPAAVLFACMLNAILLTCIAATPGTAGMQLSASGPMLALGSVALWTVGWALAALGYVVVMLIVTFYGWRLRVTLGAAMRHRYEVERLAQELRVNHQQLIAIEKERTLLVERQRLTRDMHDGLGSALVASLAAVERGMTQPAQLAALLRDCIDDLRAVIASLEPFGGDLPSLLGGERQRLERRLATAGMRLSWQVDDLPALDWFGPPQALQVVRIVHEVVANAVKHSRARQLSLSVRCRNDGIELRMADDGEGYAPDAKPWGQGTGSMHSRAAALGARLSVDAQPGRGTAVTMWLPIRVGGS